MKRKSWVISGTRFLAESLFRIRMRGRRMSSSFSGRLVGMIEARLIRGEGVLVTANMRAAIERLAFEPRAEPASQPVPSQPQPQRPAHYLSWFNRAARGSSGAESGRRSQSIQAGSVNPAGVAEAATARAPDL